MVKPRIRPQGKFDSLVAFRLRSVEFEKMKGLLAAGRYKSASQIIRTALETFLQNA